MVAGVGQAGRDEVVEGDFLQYYYSMLNSSRISTDSLQNRKEVQTKNGGALDLFFGANKRRELRKPRVHLVAIANFRILYLLPEYSTSQTVIPGHPAAVGTIMYNFWGSRTALSSPGGTPGSYPWPPFDVVVRDFFLLLLVEAPTD